MSLIVTVRLAVRSVSPMASSLMVLRKGWSGRTRFGPPGMYWPEIAAIIAGVDWSAVRCM
jgi:hypothetical protein